MTREEIVDGLELHTAGRPLKSLVSITVQELQNFIDEIKTLDQDTDKEKEIDELLESLQAANDTNAKLIKLFEKMKKSNKELRKEFCEDAVSREYLLNDDMYHTVFNDNTGVFEDVVYREDIKNAPSVTPIHSVGKWLDGYIEEGVMGITYTEKTCSKCGWSHSLLIPQNYCPKCGAKMKDEENA